jgi:hypothetical protein
MSKHTPGPWTIHPKVEGLNGIGIHSANGGYVYVATVHGLGHGNPPSETNARLIAAAPEMLMLLKGLAKINPFGIGSAAIANYCREARELIKKIENGDE